MIEWKRERERESRRGLPLVRAIGATRMFIGQQRMCMRAREHAGAGAFSK